MAELCVYCKTELNDERSVSIPAGSILLLLSRNAELAAKWKESLREKGISEVKIVSCVKCSSLHIASPLAGVK